MAASDVFHSASLDIIICKIFSGPNEMKKKLFSHDDEEEGMKREMEEEENYFRTSLRS